MSEAQGRGANAIIAMRFESGELGKLLSLKRFRRLLVRDTHAHDQVADLITVGGFAQVCTYGTACIIEKVDPELPEYPQLVRATQ